MCCCGKPTINGEQGYSWDGKQRGVYPPHPPKLNEGDTVLYDEPGRCGGLDSHAHHYVVAKDRVNRVIVIARSGCGDRRLRLPNTKAIERALSRLDSNGRYWLLNALASAAFEARQEATAKADHCWRQAAAEKRVKTRKVRNQDRIKVWIEPAIERIAI